MARLQSMSLTEFERLSDDGYRHELSNGIVVREPRPGALHGRVLMNIARQLDAYVRERGLGLVLIESGYVLNRDPNTVRGPDLSFIAKERLPERLPTGFVPFAPDLAIEILSPSNAASEIERKVLEYLDAGSSLVWVVDPDTRTARSYHGHEAVLVRKDGLLMGDPVVPGFMLPLKDIFD